MTGLEPVTRSSKATALPIGRHVCQTVSGIFFPDSGKLNVNEVQYTPF